MFFLLLVSVLFFADLLPSFNWWAVSVGRGGIKMASASTCDKFIIITIIINFFRRVFSDCTEAIATSLIPLVTNFPEICAFIIGFSFSVWTKMRPLLAH